MSPIKKVLLVSAVNCKVYDNNTNAIIDYSVKIYGKKSDDKLLAEVKEIVANAGYIFVKVAEPITCENVTYTLSFDDFIKYATATHADEVPTAE